MKDELRLVYMYNINARLHKNDPWQGFTGNVKSFSDLGTEHFRRHCQKYFEHMEYEFSLLTKIHYEMDKGRAGVLMMKKRELI